MARCQMSRSGRIQPVLCSARAKDRQRATPDERSSTGEIWFLEHAERQSRMCTVGLDAYLRTSAVQGAKQTLKSVIQFTNRGGIASTSQRGQVEDAQVVPVGE